MKLEIKPDNYTFETEIIYLYEQYEFYALGYKKKPAENVEIVINTTLSLHAENNECLSFFAYLPLSSCIRAELTIENNYSQGRLFITDMSNELEGIEKDERYTISPFGDLKNAITSYESFAHFSLEDLPTYFDRKNNILCIGDKDTKATTRAEVIKNFIVSLDENNELLSIHIKIVRMTNEKMEILKEELLSNL